jgi:hypothetical protein
MRTNLPKSEKHCKQTVENMNHSHDEDENMELMKTLRGNEWDAILPAIST